MNTCVYVARSCVLTNDLVLHPDLINISANYLNDSRCWCTENICGLHEPEKGANDLGDELWSEAEILGWNNGIILRDQCVMFGSKAQLHNYRTTCVKSLWGFPLTLIVLLLSSGMWWPNELMECQACLHASMMPRLRQCVEAWAQFGMLPFKGGWQMSLSRGELMGLPMEQKHTRNRWRRETGLGKWDGEGQPSNNQRDTR